MGSAKNRLSIDFLTWGPQSCDVLLDQSSSPPYFQAEFETCQRSLAGYSQFELPCIRNTLVSQALDDYRIGKKARAILSVRSL
jgi:hypothetical protein